MKEGDIITTYYIGYYRLTRIVQRFYQCDRDIPSFLKETVKIGDEYSPLYYFKKIADAKGNKISKPGKENCCDAAFCYPAIRSLQKMIIDHELTVMNLTKLLYEV